eukprot:37314_1
MIAQMQTDQMNKDKNKQKLNYNNIKRVLETNRFMNKKEIDNLEDALKYYTEEIRMNDNEFKYDITVLNEEKDDEKGNSKRVKRYEKDRLITELCNAFNNNEDYQMQGVLTDILITKLQFKDWEKRQQCYDLLLHQYCKKYQLNHDNFVILLVNAIKSAEDWDITDIEAIKHITQNDPKLNGRIFIKGQPEFKSNIQFAKIFEKMHNFEEHKLDTKLVQLYDIINGWQAKQYHNYENLEYDKIENILKMNGFMKEQEITTLKSQLETWKIAIDINELQQDVTAIEEEKGVENDNIIPLKGYELITELCNAFNNHKDYQMPGVLTDILITTLQFEESNKRQQFYDLLLHKYCQKYQLNNNNLVTLLVNTMKADGDWDINDIKHIEQIAKGDRKLNGKIFIKGQKEFKSSTEFAKIFEKMDNFTEHNLKKKLVHLYVRINRWESKEYEPYQQPELEMLKNDMFDDFYEIDLIRNHYTHGDDLPKYIRKCIWYQSFDDKAESLIDNAVLKVLNLGVWKDDTFINKIYNDYQFYDAIQE